MALLLLLPKNASRRFLTRSFTTASASTSNATNTAYKPPYNEWLTRLEHVKQRWPSLFNAPPALTLTDKILAYHLSAPTSDAAIQSLTRAPKDLSQLQLHPDRVAMQDASAQMALLQFMTCGKSRAALPVSVHCDHLIQAHHGADADVAQSELSEREIYQFLSSCSSRYGMAFWRPGAGIIHQIVLENYAFPGGLMLGTDSHTPNAGGLGMMAIGVGGADAVDAMVGLPWDLKRPRVLGIHLTGHLSPWASPKDVILTLAGMLTVRGATGSVIEYFGEGVETLSCTGMATICNMGAELGATTSLFPFTRAMHRYLSATRRSTIADAAQWASERGLLSADANAQYDRLIELDLSTVEPMINGPFSPDAATPISKFVEQVKDKQWPETVSAALIGSCTNSSYQDMTRAVSIARQALNKGLKTQSQFLITPGSEQIRATIERDGLTQSLEEAGGKVLANACGPCIGQWQRDTDAVTDGPNVIMTSFNRNFRARNDGNPHTMNFLASPEIVTAMAIAGKTTFNPLTDSLTDAKGHSFKLDPPKGIELPVDGFLTGRGVYYPDESNMRPDESVQIEINESSNRLQKLTPFAPFDNADLDSLIVVKAVGQCTTDHISPAGKWLKYKGHLENIAGCTLLGMRDARNVTGRTLCAITGVEKSVPDVLKGYKKQRRGWAVVAAHNYGEGSAREHAALQPRYLGCRLIIAQSFARIHETNLKKQGVLPLTFRNADDYERVPMTGVISTRGLVDLVRHGRGNVVLVITDGEERVEIETAHTMTQEQLRWFAHGSALNSIRAAQQN